MIPPFSERIIEFPILSAWAELDAYALFVPFLVQDIVPLVQIVRRLAPFHPLIPQSLRPVPVPVRRSPRHIVNREKPVRRIIVEASVPPRYRHKVPQVFKACYFRSFSQITLPSNFNRPSQGSFALLTVL